MNLNNLAILTEFNTHKLTNEQIVMCNRYSKEGYSIYIEEYSDYTYAVCIKEGVKRGTIRLNKTGHDIYV